MNDLLTKALQKKLSDVGNIQVNYLDRTNGVKSGSLFTINPSYKYLMMNSETLTESGYEYETSDPKPFDCANIMIINRYYSKKQNKWIEELVPALAINLKSTEQPDANKTRYCSMIFRGTSFDRLMDEIILAHQSGQDLDRAKALYSIIDNNGLTVSDFFEHLQSGKPISFAQYKRGNNMNFVDAKYYTEKIESAEDVSSDL